MSERGFPFSKPLPAHAARMSQFRKSSQTPANIQRVSHLHCSAGVKIFGYPSRRSFRPDAALANCTKFRNLSGELSALGIPSAAENLSDSCHQLATFNTFAPSAGSQVGSHNVV
jgi:hypothetical protein